MWKKNIMQLVSRIALPGRRPGGFTLVELMVVIAITSILASAGAYYTLNALPLLRLKRATRVLMSQMQQIKLNAIKENREWQIRFPFPFAAQPVAPAGTYQIISGGPDREMGGGDDIVVQTVRLADYGSGVTFGFGNATANWSGGATTQQNAVTFNSSGRKIDFPNSGSTYLTNQDNTIAYAITVLGTGSIKLRMYSGITPFNTRNWIN